MSGSLGKLLHETTTSTDSFKIKNGVKKALKELPFFKKGTTLQVSDPSYKLRYRLAVTFWKKETGNGTQKLDKEQAKNLIDNLREQLNDCVYEDTDDVEDITDDFFLKESTRRQSSTKSNDKPLSYITCKYKNRFYVKPADTHELETPVEFESIYCGVDIEICYELICPGDEVEVNIDTEGKKTLHILKSTGLSSEETHEAKKRFIENILTFADTRCCLDVFVVLFLRLKGIWDHIKNDTELFNKDVQCIKNVCKMSVLLSKKLSSKAEDLCKLFLEDLSSSSFFTTVLPDFIESYASELESEIYDLKSLLEMMIELVPQIASKILKVAEHLANVMHLSSGTVNDTEAHLKCRGVQFLIQLGKKLAKFVPGSQDVDTANCEWHELPTIPTEKEMLTEFDVDSLDAIRDNEPYDSVEQYLDINFKLLREECFRNLCTSIQRFRENKAEAPRNMRMYRVTLDTVAFSERYANRVEVILSCEDYFKQDSDESSQEDGNTKILYGSLMCISLDKSFGDLIWATVVDSEQQENSDKLLIHVKLCSERNKLKTVDVLLELSKITHEGDHALMAENPTFFGELGPCLDRLKEMHEKEDKTNGMPLVEELVFGKKSVPPEYAAADDVTCDWDVIFEKPAGYELTLPQDEKLSPIEQFKHLRKDVEPSRCVLDETQMLGIEQFLENRVTLIQGPPGTGKSFLGARILRLMLSMKIHERYGGPILVMTYKNLALDHFLETCLEYTPNIVRIGKSKEGNEKLEKINLRNVRGKIGSRKSLLDTQRKTSEEMRRLRAKLGTPFKCLSNPAFYFFEAASNNHIRSLLRKSNSEHDIERLFAEWNRKSNHVPRKLIVLVEESLETWLPKHEEMRQNAMKETPKLSQNRKRSGSTEEECPEDTIDKTVVAQERMQNAVEDDLLADELDNCDTQSDTEDCSEESDQDDFDQDLDLWTMSDEERRRFIQSLQKIVVRKIKDLLPSYEKNFRVYQAFKDDRIVETLKQHDVIGMTVSGAATRLHLLNELKPCAVIVEEAAEVIEGQLISVLPPTIRHLVMLGDHQQLKPRVNCYELRRKNKRLDCSMFERLINNKGMAFQQLGYQCRMRDDIADLVRSLSIYKDLKTNYEKTKNNNPPECIGESLYFVKHTASESRTPRTSSLWNQREVNLILKVAEYLVKNKYSPSDVTVLCPYVAQVKKMEAKFQERSRDDSNPAEEYLAKLRDINITTVDSFQGEENKVILLSLVRTNREEKIGFLSESNRICVAISRARCGLYVFGNSTLYSNRSQKWKNIIEVFEKRRLIGNVFPFISVEEADGVAPTKGEKLSDTTKLSPREITRLSWKIVNKWEVIAGLANLDRDEVGNVRKNNVNYSEPWEKAQQILIMINNKEDFSRKKLSHHLEEAGCTDLVTPTEDEKLSDTTKLSPREITRLSLRIVDKWEEIAGLANVDPNEVINVKKDNVSCVEPKDKAWKILTIINDKKDFSREKLSEYLKEAGYNDLVTAVIEATFRYADPDGTNFDDASTSNSG